MRTTFERDLCWSCQMREKYLHQFYQKYALNGRYVFVDKTACSTILQKRLAIDTIMQTRHGSSLCIEEKIERWTGRPRVNFALETESCTVEGRESPGWMRYAEADYLLYAFEQEGQCLGVYFINFAQLREWFWSQDAAKYRYFTMKKDNRTRGRLVPIREVCAAVSTTRYLVTETSCVQVPLNLHICHSADALPRSS